MTVFAVPVLMAHKQATASFAAGSVFLTNFALASIFTSGEARRCWIDYASATANTLRVTIDDGTASIATQQLLTIGTATAAVTASNFVSYELIINGGTNYSFSQSTGGAVNLFNLYLLD